MTTATVDGAPASTTYFKTEEAAAYARFGLSKFKELLYSGEIPCIRVGRSVRIRKQAIDDYMARMEREATVA